MGAIELNPLSAAIFNQYQTINSQSVMAFLRKILAACASMTTIPIVLNGAGYHRLETVLEAAGKQRIKRHYSPSYSPNLNLMEGLWKGYGR